MTLGEALIAGMAQLVSAAERQQAAAEGALHPEPFREEAARRLAQAALIEELLDRLVDDRRVPVSYTDTRGLVGKSEGARPAELDGGLAGRAVSTRQEDGCGVNDTT